MKFFGWRNKGRRECLIIFMLKMHFMIQIHNFIIIIFSVTKSYYENTN
jgi:hypothetical protein